MGDERQSAGLVHHIDQALGVVSVHGKLALGAEDQQVVLLWLERLVVDLLAHQEQHAALAIPVIILRTLHPNVMIGDDNRVYVALERSLGDLGVAAAAVGVRGVHVKIYDDLVHRLTN